MEVNTLIKYHYTLLIIHQVSLCLPSQSIGKIFYKTKLFRKKIFTLNTKNTWNSDCGDLKF